MNINSDLFYNDESADSHIDVLRMRKSLRDQSNPLELPSTK